MAAANKNNHFLKHFQAELNAPRARKCTLAHSSSRTCASCTVHALQGPIQHLSLKEDRPSSVAQLAQPWGEVCASCATLRALSGAGKAGSPTDS